MTTIQMNQLDTYLLIQSLFNRHTKTWSSNNRLSTAFKKFSDNIAAIETQRKHQEEKSTGIAQDKKTTKAALVKKAAFIAGAIRAYAFSVNNEELEARVPYTESMLKNLREGMLLTACQVIMEKAQANLAQLGDEGVTAELLAGTTQLIAEFTGKKIKPQEAIYERKMVTATLIDLFSTNNTLLKKQIDMLVAQYEEKSPDFYGAYLNTRQISRRGQRIKFNDSAPPLPIPNDGMNPPSPDRISPKRK